MRFNEKADAYLDALYASVGATTDEQKFNTLYLKLGYEFEGATLNFSHEPTFEQKRGMLEYELLERERLIELIYA